MAVRTALLTISVCAVSAIGPAGAADLAEPGPPLHPSADIQADPAVAPGGAAEAITPLEAAGFAVTALTDFGVTGILVCEVHRIEAPLTAYLVDAVGSIDMREMVDGVSGRDLHFDTFRVVLRDGAEYDGEINPAGERIALIARGTDPAGETVWYPGCGPDYVPSVDEPSFSDSRMQFEFLLWREDFESLATRYPRDVTAGPHCGSCGGCGADQARGDGCGGPGCN